MVLYCASLPIFLYHFMVHKLTVDKDEDVVLMFDEASYVKRNLINVVNELKNKGVFYDVIPSKMAINRKLPTIDEIKQDAIEHYDEIFSDMPYSIDSFEKIYVMNDTQDGDINLYFNLKKIEYVWIQSVENWWMEVSNAPWLPKKYIELIGQYKAISPIAEYALPCVLSGSDQSIERLKNLGREYIVWDLHGCFATLGEKELELIARCFLIDENTFSTNNSAMVIKNSYGFSLRAFYSEASYTKLVHGYCDTDNHHLYGMLDNMALDIYAPDIQRVYIKSHPNDIPMTENELNDIYGNGTTAITNIPFEFILKYFKEKHIKFDTIIGYASTALKSSMDQAIYDNLYVLGEDYLRTYCLYPSIYASAVFAVKNGFKRICAESKICTQLEFMIKSMGSDISVEEYKSDSIGSYSESLIIYNFNESLITEYDRTFTKINKTSAVFFINMDRTDAFFAEERAEHILPIVIKKTPVRNNAPDYLSDETIWAYSRTSVMREKIRSFTMSKDLCRTGIRLSIDRMPLSERIALLYERLGRGELKSRISKLESENKTLNARINNISGMIGHLSEPTVINQTGREIDNIDEYLDFLSVVRSKYLIIFSVKDTPGNNIPKCITERIHDLGFRNFTNELWKSYIGISDKGRIIADKRASVPEEALKEIIPGSRKTSEIEVTSMSWKCGNCSEIIIDGKDYSVNVRGINIVVYDTENRSVIDSVAYDAHSKTASVFKRKK